MTVLRVEVWLSIVGAIILTAIMMWILDKYSPYSAKNNKAGYPYECRSVPLTQNLLFQHFKFFVFPIEILHSKKVYGLQ